MRTVRALSGVAAMAVMAGACAPTAEPAPPPAPVVTMDTVYVVDTVEVTVESAADAQLEAQVARLQIQLLERDVQLQEMQEELSATRQEVVRNLAKLQSQATRAEAASGLAEAEIALQALGRTDGGSELPEHAQAQALLADASAEFAAENYGGAVYLATQARSLAGAGQALLRSMGTEALRSGETRFAKPVPMRTTGRSNVRGGPGTSFDVLFTLDADAELVGQSYTSQWVRVLDAQGRAGWIFHTLVTGQGR
jgi:hypothetical protein